ncbi:COG4223 family protein [Paracoccus zeaxanthinifaciens]|uniref:COG4223 family protein n=1 Tax=Paracoccus zeaxanthinifaciens TaxID=187400 RepID=UPI0003B4DB64|nr:mitofilin family membrane protein [Paracoccus zeaxanthinifaciens]
MTKPTDKNADKNEATGKAETGRGRKAAAAPGVIASTDIGQGKPAQAGQPGELRPIESQLLGDGTDGRPAAAKKAEPKPEAAAAQPAPKPASQPAPAAAPVKKTGFWPVVLGGVVAAGLGAGATILALPHLPAGMLPPGPDAAQPAPAEFDSQAVIDEAVAAAREAVANMPAAPASLPDDLAARLDALEQSPDLAAELAALRQELEDQKAQIAAIPSQSASSDATDRIEAAAAEAEARLQAARDEAEALQQAAAETTRRAEAVAAVASLQAALDRGVTADEAKSTLEGAGIDAPDAFSQDIPSLGDLQDAFPEAARAALRADLSSSSASGEGNVLTNFLRAQTGARSVAPREGDDTDAILSRAEATLNGGDVAATVAELEALPQPAAEAPAMADWLTRAKTHSEAQSALSDLSSTQD